VIGKGADVVVLDGGDAAARWNAEAAAEGPVFDVSAGRVIRVHEGRLLREGALGSERIGDVLTGQTRFWVGPTFGFGFYRAGRLQVGFVFEAARGGLNDGVALPRIGGQLTYAHAVFGPDRCWLFLAVQENARTMHRVVAIGRDGRVLGSAVAAEGDGTWLGHLGQPCAVGTALLVPTDDGLVRVEVDGTSVAKTREFPDTEPFVTASAQLLAGHDGLYVVEAREIWRLTLKA
jgi:H/ACA ribonucleoprotein complex subunit 3